MSENRPDPSDPAPPDAFSPLSRQDRLAAKLRENLRRRKTQARQISEDTGALPKSDGKS